MKLSTNFLPEEKVGSRFARTAVVWLILLAAIGGLTGLGNAQIPDVDPNVPEFEDIGQPDRSVFMPVPREILRPLLRASRLLREGDRKKAVALLGEILSEPVQEDFLVPASGIKGAEGVNISLRAKAQQMLGALTTADREPYRLRYGTQASQLLARGVETNDFKVIAEVMGRFFYTEAGFSAAMLLGHHHLDQGRSVAAAICFQRVSEFPEAQQIHDPSATVLLAISWMIADSPERASDALQQLKLRQPNGQIEFEGKRVALFETNDQALSWLKNLIGNSSLREIGTVDQWTMFGGNPQRNARSGNGFPLIQPRWVVPVENHPDVQTALVERQKQLLFLDAALIPALQPLAVKDTIVMRSFDRMVGIDFSTGKRKWVFPPWSLTHDGEAILLATPKKIPMNRGILTERLWQDSIYGQSSSDGALIFVVPNPGFTKSSWSLDRGDVDLAEPITQKEFNELSAIDIALDGALRWEVGGLSGLAEPLLAKAYFLGPPLPLEGTLYAICQQEQQIRLVALDPLTGKLFWSQQLVSIEKSVDVANDPLRRLAGATPAFANGVLICPTGAGALVAVDLSTRSLRWGYQFATPGRKNVAQISPDDGSLENELDGLWKDNSILIADGCVLHTPVDSQFLVCVDLESGFPKWKRDGKLVGQYPRNDSLFVGCIDSGNLILIGRSSVRAVRLADGFPMWELKTQSYGRPSGRGYVNFGSYYLPMTSSQLLKFDLATGSIQEVVRTDGVLGNLVCYRDEVISHSTDRIAVYRQDQPARQRVIEAEAAANGSKWLTPEILALKSQLQYQAGDLRESALSLAAAFEQSPDPRHAVALRARIIELLTVDYKFGLELLERLGEPIFSDQKFELAADKIDGLIHSGEHRSALEQLLGLLSPQQLHSIDRTAFVDIVEDQANQVAKIESSTQISMRIETWLATRLATVTNVANETELADFRTAVEIFLRSNIELDSIELAQCLQAIPKRLILSPRRIELAIKFLADGEPLRAWQLLEDVFATDDERSIETAHSMLQGIYRDLQMDNRIVATSTTKNVERDRMRSSQTSFHRATATFSDAEYNSDNDTQRNEVLIQCVDEDDLREYQFSFLTETGELEVLDGNGKLFRKFLARQNGVAANPARGNVYFGEVNIVDDLMLLNIGRELFAIDWLKLCAGENPIRWNITVSRGDKDQSSSAPAKIWGETPNEIRRVAYEEKIFVAALSRNGICYLDGSHLVSVDPYSGERRWLRANFSPHSMLFGNADQVVVWNQHTRDVCLVDIVTGTIQKRMLLAPELGAVWTNQGVQLLFTRLINLEHEVETPAAKNMSRQNADDERQGNSDETYQEDPRKLQQQVGLYDLLDEKFLWQHRFPFRSVGCRTTDQQLAVLHPGGELELIQLANGEKRSVPIEGLDTIERRQITGIGISRMLDSRLIYLKNSVDANGSFNMETHRIDISAVHYYDTFWSGHLLSLDTKTGTPNWERPVRFDSFQIPKAVPYRSPVSILVRRFDRDYGDTNHYFMQFLMLDLRTGKPLVNESIPFVYRNSYRIRWLPHASQMEIGFSSNRLSVEFVRANDAPPRPVASLSNVSTIPMTETGSSKAPADPERFARELETLKRNALSAEQKSPQQRAAESAALELEGK